MRQRPPFPKPTAMESQRQPTNPLADMPPPPAGTSQVAQLDRWRHLPLRHGRAPSHQSKRSRGKQYSERTHRNPHRLRQPRGPFGLRRRVSQGAGRHRGIDRRPPENPWLRGRTRAGGGSSGTTALPVLFGGRWRRRIGFVSRLRSPDASTLTSLRMRSATLAAFAAQFQAGASSPHRSKPAITRRLNTSMRGAGVTRRSNSEKPKGFYELRCLGHRLHVLNAFVCRNCGLPRLAQTANSAEEHGRPGICTPAPLSQTNNDR